MHLITGPSKIGLRNMIADENASDHRSLKDWIKKHDCWWKCIWLPFPQRLDKETWLLAKMHPITGPSKIGLRNMIAGENASDHGSLKDWIKKHDC